ncbi:IS701 family transposase, partial [Micromonospora fluostatini]
EVRRLLAHLITTVRPFDYIHRWSRWRRRHQCRARTAHYQRRLQLHQVRLEY